MLLISHADDFGLHPEIDAGILKAAQLKRLTGTTMMVTAHEPPALLGKLARTDILIGLHLNLTEGKPLSPKRSIPHLVNKQGQLSMWPTLIAKMANHRIPKKEVICEIRRQLEQFKDWTGHYPTHIDSHHYIHSYPPLAKILLDLAEDYDKPTFRWVERIQFGNWRDWRWVNVNLAMKIGAKCAHSLNQPVADGIIDPRWLPKPTLAESIKKLSNNSAYEIVWHLANGESFPWRVEQQEKIEDPRWWGKLPKSVKFGTYRDLNDLD